MLTNELMEWKNINKKFEKKDNIYDSGELLLLGFIPTASYLFRKENVNKILETLCLPEAIVTSDDRPGKNDAMYTARKAWATPVPEGCTHRLVLQDDIEICDNFIEIVNKVAKSKPNQIISFAHLEELPTDNRYYSQIFDMGIALMIPVKLLNDFWWFVDNRLPVIAKPRLNELLKHDTTCMRYWIRYQNIPCVTTVPSLV
jgi:hypothetical protein